MAGTVITAQQTVGVHLTLASQDPVTVSDTGGVQVLDIKSYAINGDASQAWHIGNAGTLAATGSGSFGITLAASGTVTNGDGMNAAAQITGGTTGITIAAAGALVTNYGTIAGNGLNAIELGAGGTVANTGTAAMITASSDAVFFGIAAKEGFVTNVSGGVITGRKDGVNMAGAATATVFNDGLITGTGAFGMGVRLQYGGLVVNGSPGNTNAAISGGGINGIEIDNVTGSVANYGTIRGAVDGIAVYHGGNVTNGSATDTAAYIFGGSNAGVVLSLPSTATNFGTIVNSGGAGVYSNAGTVVNGSEADTAALIHGAHYGIHGAALAANFGTVQATGAYGAGISEPLGGTAVNGSTADTAAFIGGYHGVNLQNGAILQNFGTVAATRGDIGPGVQIATGGTVVNGAAGSTAALISGAFAGNPNFSDGVRLYSGAAVVTNFGTVAGEEGIYVANGVTKATITNAGTISGGNGLAVSLHGKSNRLVVDPGAVFLGSIVAVGTSALELAVGSGTGTIAGIGPTFQNFGTIVVDKAAQWQFDGANTIGAGVTLNIVGTAVGSGTLLLQGGTADLSAGTAASTLTFDFAGSAHDQLTVGADGGQFANAITNLGTADRVEVGGGVSFDSAVLAGTTLTLKNGASPVFSFTDVALESGTPALFAVGTDAGSGNHFVEVACFAAGTRIATPDGEVAVETLAPDDRVQLAAGGVASVVWVGRRRVNCLRHPRPASVWPVRIAAGAFAPGVPCRDLLLSPDHAVLANGVLIPIKHLINAATVTQEQRDEVTYFHVELDRHELLLANGLAAESFLRGASRAAFDNGGEPVQLYPDFHRLAWEAEGCAPLFIVGPELDAVRAELLQRAAELAAQRKPSRSGARKVRAA